MKHIERNEIRKRQTDTATYYVIGEKVRNDFLAIVSELQDAVGLNHLPHKWNNNDKDALETMCHWLEDERDFNHKQLVKFFRMLSKFGLPDSIKGLGKEFNWEFGKSLTRTEMYEIMEERRNNARIENVEADATTELKAYTRKTTYNNLFE